MRGLKEWLERLNVIAILVTWRDVSSPPCRRIADSSRHLCGWPSACWFISVCPFGFPPVMMMFTFIFHCISLIVPVHYCPELYHSLSPAAFVSVLFFSLVSPLATAATVLGSFPELEGWQPRIGGAQMKQCWKNLYFAWVLYNAFRRNTFAYQLQS